MTIRQLLYQLRRVIEISSYLKGYHIKVTIQVREHGKTSDVTEIVYGDN